MHLSMFLALLSSLSVTYQHHRANTKRCTRIQTIVRPPRRDVPSSGIRAARREHSCGPKQATTLSSHPALYPSPIYISPVQPQGRQSTRREYAHELPLPRLIGRGTHDAEQAHPFVDRRENLGRFRPLVSTPTNM